MNVDQENTLKALFKNKKFLNALRFLRKLKKSTSEKSDKYILALNKSNVYLNLSFKYKLFEKYCLNNGIKILLTAIDIIDYAPDAYFRLGAFYYQVSDLNNSLKNYKKAYEISHAHVMIYFDKVMKSEIKIIAPNDIPYFNIFINSSSSLSAYYNANGQLEDSKKIFNLVISMFEKFPEILCNITTSQLVSFLSQNVLYYNIKNDFKGLKDFLNSERFIFLITKINDNEKIKPFLLSQKAINNLPEQIFSYESTYSLEEWTRENMKTIYNAKSIDDYRDIWDSYKRSTTSQKLHADLLNLMNFIEESFKKENEKLIKEQQKFDDKFDKQINELLEIDEKLPNNDILKTSISAVKVFSKSATNLNQGLLFVNDLIYKDIKKCFEESEKIPFLFKLRWFFLSIFRQIVRIILGVIIIGTISSFITGILNLSFLWITIISIISFAINEIFFESWIKDKFTPRYKRFINRLYFILNRNLFFQYNNLMLFRNELIVSYSEHKGSTVNVVENQ